MRPTTAITAALCCFAAVATAVPADAAATDFTITETIRPGIAKFTATGPLCPSGTFEDEVQNYVPTSDGFNITITTVYTCKDGSGTFFARKQLHITYTDTGFTGSGPIQLRGGTGAYTDLSGSGIDSGTTTGNVGIGQISGVIVA